MATEMRWEKKKKRKEKRKQITERTKIRGERKITGGKKRKKRKMRGFGFQLKCFPRAGIPDLTSKGAR